MHLLHTLPLTPANAPFTHPLSHIGEPATEVILMTSGTAALCRIVEETKTDHVIEKRRPPITKKRTSVYAPPWRRLVRRFRFGSAHSSKKSGFNTSSSPRKSPRKDKGGGGGGGSAHGFGGSSHGFGSKFGTSVKMYNLELAEEIDSDDEEAVTRRDKVLPPPPLKLPPPPLKLPPPPLKLPPPPIKLPPPPPSFVELSRRHLLYFITQMPAFTYSPPPR